MPKITQSGLWCIREGIKVEVQNITITISGALGLFLSLVSPRMSALTSFFLIFGFSLLFVSRLSHFLLMQYNRLDSQLHKTSSIMTGLGLLSALIGMLIGRFTSPGVILIPTFGYYLLLAMLWTLAFVVYQGIATKPFNQVLNIGASKVEMRKKSSTITDSEQS